jgi:hypothetical protein
LVAGQIPERKKMFILIFTCSLFFSLSHFMFFEDQGKVKEDEVSLSRRIGSTTGGVGVTSFTGD